MGRAQLDEHSTAKWCRLFFREFLALGKKKNPTKYIFLALKLGLTLLIRINLFSMYMCNK